MRRRQVACSQSAVNPQEHLRRKTRHPDFVRTQCMTKQRHIPSVRGPVCAHVVRRSSLPMDVSGGSAAGVLCCNTTSANTADQKLESGLRVPTPTSALKIRVWTLSLSKAPYPSPKLTSGGPNRCARARPEPRGTPEVNTDAKSGRKMHVMRPSPGSALPFPGGSAKNPSGGLSGVLNLF